MSSSDFSQSDEFNPPEDNRLYPELFALHHEIHNFSENLGDFVRLLQIQKRIIDSIMEAEKEIRWAKQNKHNHKDWQYVRYNFLCLGDCLSFLYMDRFTLKQTYFDVDSRNQKQSGGFISGKAGYENEVCQLENIISHDIPAILCDLTNVLRYGDICVMGSDLPLLIEVKSSKLKDKRGKRQKIKLQTLSNFLISDRADNFRGLPGVTIRTEQLSLPRTYTTELQAAIKEAMIIGSTSFEVDECLHAVIIADENVDYGKLLEGKISSRSIAFLINKIKTDMLWGCYYPFSLSLSETTLYEAFVRGKVFILILLDMAAFEEKMSSDSFRLTVETSEDGIQCHVHFSNVIPGTQETNFTICEHMMGRMWTDFIRPSWIVENAIFSVKNACKTMSHEIKSE